MFVSAWIRQSTTASASYLAGHHRLGIRGQNRSEAPRLRLHKTDGLRNCPKPCGRYGAGLQRDLSDPSGHPTIFEVDRFRSQSGSVGCPLGIFALKRMRGQEFRGASGASRISVNFKVASPDRSFRLPDRSFGLMKNTEFIHTLYDRAWTKKARGRESTGRIEPRASATG